MLLLACLIGVLTLWYRSEGTISVNTVSTPRVEAFYWAAITFSQTLGTALGDWIADTGGLGYEGGALVFAGGLAILAALYYSTDVSRVGFFLGGLHFDPTPGRDIGRFPRQAARPWRVRLEPPHCVGSHRGNHDRLHRLFSARSGQPSCREPGVERAIECPLRGQDRALKYGSATSVFTANAEHFAARSRHSMRNQDKYLEISSPRPPGVGCVLRGPAAAMLPLARGCALAMQASTEEFLIGFVGVNGMAAAIP